jgi:steroid 5-alpha reductase family enzyme
MTEKKLSSAASSLIMASVYLFTIGASILIGMFLPIESPLFKAAAVDGIATVIIFAFSMLFNNSSMYDPYWSAAPIVFVGYWVGASAESLTLRSALILLLTAIWGVRLTFNFWRRWKGIHHEDWRYADYRVSAKKLYWVLSFFGFHLFPTIIVFAAGVPIYYAVTSSAAFNLVDIAAAIIAVIAILIEAGADSQMRRHVLTGGGNAKTYRSGLWAYSRHPNYFGEVLFWWGMFVFVSAADFDHWWTVFGPLGVTVLFSAISLRLIETRMCERHPDYAQIQKEISILIPWFPRSARKA